MQPNRKIGEKQDEMSRPHGSPLVILEVGCGVGNFLFPLLEEDQTLFFYACDFSPRAVKFMQENPLYDEDHCHAFQCDITRDSLTEHVHRPIDLITMIFVLSAIHPDKMRQALENIAQVLPPGGRVLFRDYGMYDHAMLRFSRGHKLAEQFYVRQDGTRAYYFYKGRITTGIHGFGSRPRTVTALEVCDFMRTRHLCARIIIPSG
ncbi:tRNA N(3)-methylcytidine methyltransferase METTL6 [Lamellibrachia satsuma]|nr:tRNA N(3)-methylcytidine methyltransferase METTL6 [Lamellibrachia satsuma]